MNTEHYNLQRKVNTYKDIVKNTRAYREVWKDSLKDLIIKQLTDVSTGVGLEGKVEIKAELENLEAVVFSLGDVKSGMYQEVNESIKRHLIKHNGSLIYQQLFNGKVIVIINYPYIENYGKPHPPKTLAIYRPEELKEPFIIRHLEELITDITNWEDYDDDEPNKKIGFKFNFENQGAEE
ncbi:MAG: hypothetical protein ACI9XO_003675 [Paraglaciecola sp.]|jgi:hypothetical protein